VLHKSKREQRMGGASRGCDRAKRYNPARLPTAQGTPCCRGGHPETVENEML
jgi:hypothetical protein